MRNEKVEITMDSSKKQLTDTQKLAAKFADSIANAADFVATKELVMQFITELDSKVYVLGDGDLAALYARRGKDLKTGFLILQCSTLHMRPAIKRSQKLQ